MISEKTLAVNGGKLIRSTPWPSRGIIDIEEKNALIKLLDDAISSGNAPGYNGPKEDEYCKKFAEFLGGGFADGINSGTNSVYVALRSMELPMFSEVIVSSVTDAGGMMPIAIQNLIPVPADVMPDSYNIGPEQIEARITPYTSAILVSHIAGEPADIEGIMELAHKHNLKVIEDCSQTHGASINGRMVGTFGDVAAFSTMFGKHHCTGGQGGIVFTRSEETYWKVRRYADRGKPFGLNDPKLKGNQVCALNCNMDEFSATIGIEQIKKLPAFLKGRRAFVKYFRTELDGCSAVSIPVLKEGVESACWFLRLFFNPDAVTCDRETFMKALIAEEIPVTGDYISIATPHRMDWFTKHRVFGTNGYPWAAPEYKGNADAQYDCPNIDKVAATNFILYINESWGEQEAKDAAAIFKRVSGAFEK